MDNVLKDHRHPHCLGHPEKLGDRPVCPRIPSQAANDGFDQRLSTAKRESGILVDVHSV
jgi:hypothetical protein